MPSLSRWESVPVCRVGENVNPSFQTTTRDYGSKGFPKKIRYCLDYTGDGG